MTIDPTIPFRAINHFDAAGAISNAFSVRDAARRSQMQDMQFQQQQEDRTLAQTRRQQFGQTLGGMVPPELAEFAKADPEGAMKLWEFKKSASKEQRQSFIDSQDMIANVAGNLRAVPQEQRAAAFQQIAPQLLQRGFNEKMLGSVNLTDAGLDGYISSSLGAKTVMEFGAKARDDDRADATLANKVQQDNINNGFQAANLGVAQANLGLRQVEVAQSAAGVMSPKEARRATTQYRKEFDTLPEVKAFKEIAPVLVSARRAPDNAAGDIQLAYTVGKILDPNSVVREGELALAVKAGSPLERLIGSGVYTLGNGGRMTPTIRKQLLGMLNERALANRQAYDAARANFVGYAERDGIPARDVVGTHVASAYGAQQQRAAPASGGGGRVIDYDANGKRVR